MNMVKKLVCGVISAAVALGAASAWAAGTSAYVQDGLIACWDGIENAGAGVHDGSATVWKDVKGGYEFALTGVTVDDDRMTFAGSASSYGTLSAADTTSTFVAAKNGTLEIVYRSNTGSGSQVFLQAPATSGIAFGIWETSKILNFSSVSQVNKSAFTFSSVTATNCVSVRYSSGEPVSAIGNDTALGIPSSNYWSYPSGETKTFVGVRASKANNFFAGSIYCIRLYSRQLTDAEIAANHAIDQMRFILHVGSDTLNVTSSAEGIGSPSPAYGLVSGLVAGETVSVSCGNAVVTNANGSVYSCTGWKTYDEDGTQVSSGSDTSFTYTHSSPAEYCELQWQWEMTSPPTGYVSDGLIAFWDGIQNAGSGVHVDGTNIWRDLVHGYEFSLTGTTVDADRMTFDGTSSSYGTLSATDTTSTFVAAKDGTLEIVYRSETGSGSQILMQSSSASGLAFGIWETTKILPYTSSSQTAMQGFAHSSGTATNFVAVRYASSSPVSALANGSQLGSSGSSTWANPGNVTVIGHRYSKENLGFNGSIYAIRLYSRRLTDMEIIDNQTVDQQRFSQSVDNSRLVISSTPEGAGRPSPADGYVTGLAAGDTRIVTCGGAITWTNAAGRVFACLGWKLYDANDDVVDSGSTLSFVYTHPTRRPRRSAGLSGSGNIPWRFCRFPTRSMNPLIAAVPNSSSPTSSTETRGPSAATS